MSGETDLEKLLKNLSPKLNEGEYVFVTMDSSDDIPSEAISQFKEKEGISIIVEKEVADKLNLSYTYVAHWITLEVHSSLHVVGLIATIANALAEKDISCNAVSGYYHDHLFVEKKDSKQAMDILRKSFK